MDRKKKKLPTITKLKDLLMLKLSKFYSDKKNINAVIQIIQNTDDESTNKTKSSAKSKKISLRLIDWFVTNYSKKYNTVISQKDDKNNIVHFNVYLSYRSQLQAFRKELFDPFRRRDRIQFYYEPNKYIETTIGQLNLFRWLLENQILEYIQAHFKHIDADMQNVQQENVKKKQVEANMNIKTIQTDSGIVVQKRKKRNALSTSSVKNLNFSSGNRIISFD